MKTTIYLTRHGQTQWNIEKRLQGRGNSPLTEAGIQRAEELAKRLASIDLDRIYTSPIERAHTTAHILKGDKEVEIVTHEGLVEMSFGAYEGRKIDDVLAENPKWNISLVLKGNTEVRTPNGETLGEVRARVRDTMDHLIRENKGKTFLIVAHGVTLKALMHYFNDPDVNGEVMGQATLTKIEIDENDQIHIIYKDDASHFTVQEQKMGW